MKDDVLSLSNRPFKQIREAVSHITTRIRQHLIKCSRLQDFYMVMSFRMAPSVASLTFMLASMGVQFTQ